MDEQQSSSKATIIDTTSQVSRTKAVNDEKVWLEILSLKLKGVGVHTHLAQLSEFEGLEGYCAMHKYHAIEEYRDYIWLSSEYIKKFSKIPNTEMEQKDIKDSFGHEPFVKKMAAILEIYNDWELEVLEKLREYKIRISGCKKDINKLICDVKEELYFIDKLNDYIDEHGDDEAYMHKMNEWLKGMYGKKLQAFNK